MRIGELAQASRTTTKTLRFYEARGLLPAPVRTPGGYRDFGPESTARVDFIRRGRAAGLSLAQIREIIDVHDSDHIPCGRVRQLLTERLTDLERQIADLQALRVTVSELRDTVAEAEPAGTDAGQICPYL